MSKPSAAEFAAKAQRYLGRSYADMDCQALMEAMLRDVGISANWPGSNAMFRDMAWTGTPEECVARFGRVPVGAWLYILLPSGTEPQRYRSDGLGDASHVGVKTGIGKGAIHSSASRGGVVESAFLDKTIPNGGWNMVGLSKLLNYGLNIQTKENQSMTQQATVTAPAGSTVNLRKSPGGALVARVPVGDVVVVSAQQDGWSRVSYGDHSGWIMTSFLQGINPAPTDDLPRRLAELEQRVDLAEKRLAALDGGLG